MVVRIPGPSWTAKCFTSKTRPVSASGFAVTDMIPMYKVMGRYKADPYPLDEPNKNP